MIPQETIAKILDTAQVADIVGDFIPLRKKGGDLVACCPFHNEKTPSFHVNVARGFYKCFGCGASGSAVGFLMNHESMTYPEALKYIARRYGIEVIEKEETAEDLAAKSHRESLYLVMQFAHKFYMDALMTEEGQTVAMAYYHGRGLQDDTIRAYGLGWAPKSRHALVDAAVAKGYNIDYLLELSLCVKYDDGRIMDRFYDRVMFPIHSHSGQVIGFGGRTLFTDKSVAKYINSNQSEIYDKSQTLYGINFAKTAIHKEDRCYLVEGYLDVLSTHQLGIKNVVASSGTSLTIPQIRLIKKFSDNVTIMYDGDGAGIKAALRGIDLVLKEGLKVKVVLLPDGDDPDSYSRKHTLEEFRQFISDHEQDFIEFKSDLSLGEAGNDPLRKAELINEVADSIALIPDAVTRTVYCQTVADKFGMDSQVIFGRVRHTREKSLEEERKRNKALIAQTDSRDDAIASEEQTAVETTAGAVETQMPAWVADKTLDGPVYEAPLLKVSETDLLSFMINSGMSLLEFESDSRYYTEEPSDVASFISVNLDELGLSFRNSVLKRAYDMYLDLYDNHPEKDQVGIVRAMMDDPDREVADLVAGLAEEKYKLSVENFANSMTAKSTQLVKFVPRTIMTYQLDVLKFEGFALAERMKTASPEEQLNLLMEQKELSDRRKTLEEMLGRIR